jgi:hypothetical protein
VVIGNLYDNWSNSGKAKSPVGGIDSDKGGRVDEFNTEERYPSRLIWKQKDIGGANGWSGTS